MVRRWLGYSFIVVCAIAFRAAYTGWLAGIVLVFVALAPALGVVVSLPNALSAKALLRAQPGELSRGETGRWMVGVRSGLDLPLPRVRLKVTWENLLTGEKQAGKVCLKAGEEATLPCAGEHCGLFVGQVSAAWAVDCLGLFWLPLRRGKEAELLVLPGRSKESVTMPTEESPGLRPRPGGGPGEDYDPRDYRAGDPLNTIHWKLSAKRDELIVRETLEDVAARPTLIFDHFGTPEELDKVMERLRGLGEALLEAGRGFDVAWAHAVTGEGRRFAVDGEAALRRCLGAALAERAPLEGRSILDAAGYSKAVYLSPERGRAL